MRKLQIICFCLFVFIGVQAQDGHYTQFFQNPLFLNPALTSAQTGQIRLGGIYRSQWQAIQSPYVNYGVFADVNIKNFSVGFLANQNKAGDAGYKKSNTLFSLGYRKPLGDGYNALSIGAQIGLNQSRIDPNKLTFDNQYNPDIGFDETQLSGEAFVDATMKATDINIGLAYHFDLDQDLPIQGEIGLAVYHVNQPEFTSLAGETLNIDRKLMFHGKAFVHLNEGFGVEPMVLFAQQGAANELIGGLNLGFNMSDTSGFKLGIGTRLKDAILFQAQFNFQKMSLGFGFDYNISKLQQAGGFNNAMEISMIYRIPLKIKAKEWVDTDGDGIIDRRDKCPKVPGLEKLKGCPEELAEKEKPVLGLDTDGDGITNDNDLCPYIFGYLKYQGCNDQDGDTIWDHIDACPALPGKVENQGCPIEIPGIDSDRDGVPDRFDKCIYVKGPERFNGCPDTDEDGIMDIDDECPYLKGKKVWNGCPGDPENNMIVSRGKQQISIDIVEFATDKSFIRGDYREMLDRVAEHMNRQRNRYNLVLEGHTDNEGSPSYNFQLSQKRVHAVRDYLISRGVDNRAITIYHFGENKPKSGNDTDYGRARNRRVELILFEVE